MKSYTCIVEGTKVNDGKFQSWVRATAERLQLKGWVRNIANNKAEILVQGESESYAALRESLKTKAPIPDLKSVSCQSLDYDKVHTGFETRG